MHPILPNLSSDPMQTAPRAKGRAEETSRLLEKAFGQTGEAPLSAGRAKGEADKTVMPNTEQRSFTEVFVALEEEKRPLPTPSIPAGEEDRSSAPAEELDVQDSDQQTERANVQDIEPNRPGSPSTENGFSPEEPEPRVELRERGARRTDKPHETMAELPFSSGQREIRPTAVEPVTAEKGQNTIEQRVPVPISPASALPYQDDHRIPFKPIFEKEASAGMRIPLKEGGSSSQFNLPSNNAPNVRGDAVSSHQPKLEYTQPYALAKSSDRLILDTRDSSVAKGLLVENTQSHIPAEANARTETAAQVKKSVPSPINVAPSDQVVSEEEPQSRKIQPADAIQKSVPQPAPTLQASPSRGGAISEPAAINGKEEDATTALMKVAGQRPIAPADDVTVLHQVIRLKGTGPIAPDQGKLVSESPATSALRRPLRSDQTPAFTPPQPKVDRGKADAGEMHDLAKTQVGADSRLQTAQAPFAEPRGYAPPKTSASSVSLQAMQIPKSESPNPLTSQVHASPRPQAKAPAEQPSQTYALRNERLSSPTEASFLSGQAQTQEAGASRALQTLKGLPDPVSDKVGGLDIESPRTSSDPKDHKPQKPIDGTGLASVTRSALGHSADRTKTLPFSPPVASHALRSRTEDREGKGERTGDTVRVTETPVLSSMPPKPMPLNKPDFASLNKIAPASVRETKTAKEIHTHTDVPFSGRLDTTAATNATQGPASPPNLPVQLARQMMEVARSLPSSPVEISLKPEELGRVRLALSTAEGALVVQVQAERSDTLDLLRRHIQTLNEEFRALGYGDVTFSFGGQGQDRQSPIEGDPANAPSVFQETEELAPLPAVGSKPKLNRTSGLDLRL